MADCTAALGGSEKQLCLAMLVVAGGRSREKGKFIDLHSAGWVVGWEGERVKERLR
jgi:hypothetical protein